MKILSSSGLLLGLLALPMAATAAFVTDFNSLSAGQVAGQAGWSINGDTTPDNSFVVNGTAGNKFGALGGFLTNPLIALASINLVNSAGTQIAAGSNFSASYALVNRSTLAAPNNFGATTPDDWFGFTLGDTTGDVFSLSLRAGASANLRAVFINGTQVASLNAVIASDYANPAFTPLNVSFSNVGGNLSYTGSTGGGGVLLTGSIAGKGTTTFTTVGLDWDVKNTPNSSQSFRLVDSLNLVPEPSAGLMGLLSMGRLAARRRR